MNWNIEKIKTAVVANDKGYPLFPRRLLFNLGWDVPEYNEYRIKYLAGALEGEQKEYFSILKCKVDESLCWVQELALHGKITANMYEATIREFESAGKSIKETATAYKDKFDKLQKQKQTQVNNSSIKL